MSSSVRLSFSASAYSPSAVLSRSVTTRASAATMSTNCVAARRLHVGKRDEALGGGAQVRHRRPNARRERLQELQSLAFAPEQAAHVVEREHDSGHAAFGRQERGDLDAQQRAVRGGGDGARVRALDAALELLMDLVERVRHLVAVEEPENGAAQAERHEMVADRTAVRTSEQLRRARVVQQNAAVGVADEHALGKLGHQRREPVALLLDARARIAALRLEVALEPAIALGELVDRRRHLAQLRSAAGGHVVLRVRGEQDAGLVGELVRRLRIAAEDPRERARADEQQDSRGVDQCGRRVGERLDEYAARRASSAPDGRDEHEHADDREHADLQYREPQPVSARHPHAFSRRSSAGPRFRPRLPATGGRTAFAPAPPESHSSLPGFASPAKKPSIASMRSCVENGFVM